MSSQGFSFPPPPPPPPPNSSVAQPGFPGEQRQYFSGGRGYGGGNPRGGPRGNASPGRGRGSSWPRVDRSSGFNSGSPALANGPRNRFSVQGLDENSETPPGFTENYRKGIPNGAWNHGIVPVSPTYNSARNPVPVVHSHPYPQSSASGRLHSAAVSGPPNRRPQAPPSVPSFGAPLPPPPVHSVPPPAPSTSRPPKKKHPRTHNKLGLTPATEEHESSSESAPEVDEEAKLAASSQTAGVQISYRGQTSTLKSAADIAAWIAERKRKYPTKERVEARLKESAERKKKLEEARKVRNELLEAQRAERKRQWQEQRDTTKQNGTKRKHDFPTTKAKSDKQESYPKKGPRGSSQPRSIASDFVPSSRMGENVTPKAHSAVSSTLRPEDEETNISLCDVTSSSEDTQEEDEENEATSSSGSSSLPSSEDEGVLEEDKMSNASSPSGGSDAPERLPTRGQPVRLLPDLDPPRDRNRNRDPRRSATDSQRNEFRNERTPSRPLQRRQQTRTRDHNSVKDRDRGKLKRRRQGIYSTLMEKQEYDDAKRVVESVVFLKGVDRI